MSSDRINLVINPTLDKPKNIGDIEKEIERLQSKLKKLEINKKIDFDS